MTNGTIMGKRKLYATLAYVAGAFIVGGCLVSFGKITGTEFVSTLDAAKYVVIAYLGVNAAGAAINKFGKKE